VNKKNAKSADMKSLINFVKKKVKDKTGVKLELEIVLVE
jgi:UDP-N-acetylmuramate dehydrogenase